MVKSICKNKKAFFSYEIFERYISGIVLVGSEVKALRAGKVAMGESYCFIHNNEIFIKNMHISEHSVGGKYNNHEPLRDRKLLLKKKEIIELNEKVKQKGLTIVPLEVFLSKTGLIKVEIGLAKGKHLFDKKASIKLRDLDRELKQEN